jgi:hypothetical protein
VVVISAAVEGLIDEAVVKRLIREAGATVGPIYGKQGKRSLRAGINGYNNAGRYRPWMVLVDLDQDADCAPSLCRAWISKKSPKLCFRVAVREVEAWLLSDRESIARFLSVPISRVPIHPESEIDPKQTMVNLATLSKRRDIREDMFPRPGSSRSVGPAYTSRLVEFVQSPESHWRPNHAARHSESLRRCMRCLEQLVQMEARSN